MKVALRIILFNCLISLATISVAQKKIRYDQTFYKIDSLALEHKAKDALVLINVVNDQARKEGNTSMLLKSVMYRMLFKNYLEPNTQAKLIETLKQDINGTKQPEKSLLQSLLAESYWNYYQQNRYRISQRTMVNTDIGTDISTWSVMKLTDEAIKYYLASLNEKKLLQSTRIGVIEQVLVGDTATRYLRPTVYDLLAHRALSVFMNTQVNVARPAVEELSFDKRLFTDAKTFATSAFGTSDSTSFALPALKIFQELLMLHDQTGHKAAYADADLRRIRFSYQLSGSDDKVRDFFNSLQQMLPAAEGTDIYTDILYEQARLYKNNQVKPMDKNNLVKTMDLIEKAISSRPNSPGAQNAAKIAEDIRSKELVVSIKDYIAPNQPVQVTLTYKNVRTAYFRLYKVAAGDSRVQSLYNNRKLYFDFLKKEKSVRDWHTDLPAYTDYNRRKFGDYMEGLPLGHYVLIVQDKDVLDTLGEDLVNSYTNFKVTEMGVSYRTIESNHHQYIVRNNWDGKPLKEVKIQEYIDRLGANYQHNEVPGPVLKTDEKGFAASDAVQYVSKAILTHGVDTVHLTIYNRRKNYNPVKRVVLFTDRPIYRPGQTIFYKGLFMQSLDSKNDILPDQQISVTFYDANNQILGNEDLTTNDFGTFQGSFAIPMGKLNGSMRINTPHGNIAVQVEEYKRPRFEVKFDDPKERYKLGDSILVKGKATSFSGYQIGRASVRYAVYRTGSNGYRDYDWGSSKMLASGNTSSDTEGNFNIKFFATRNEESKEQNYTFIVKADVTDLSGETRSAERNVIAGDRDIKLITGIPEFMYLTAKPDTIHAALQNLNGQPINGKLNVAWYALQSPERLTHTGNYHTQVDDYRLDRGTFIGKFPYQEYTNENRVGEWPVSSTAAFTKELDAEAGSAPILLSKKDLKPGYYKVIFSARNADNDTVRTDAIVRIYDTAPEKILTMNEWLRAEKYLIKPNEQAVFRVAGISSGAIAYYEVYYKNEVTEKVWLELSPTQTLVKISPKAHYDKSFAVQFSFVQHGITYNQLQTIYIQDNTKELEIKFLSFRDKLQPGEQEKWKLKISNKAGQKQMAEMVATLYDASLDALKKMDWQQIHAGHYYGEYTWNTNLGGYNDGYRLGFLRKTTQYFGEFVREYESLNSFLLPYGNVGSAMYNRYLQTADKNLLIEDSRQSAAKLAALQKGIKVYGVVRDEFGIALAGAIVTTAHNVRNTTDRYGIFEIKAQEGQIISVQAIGFQPYSVKLKFGQRRLDITLKSASNELNEVVVRGYQKRTREVTTGSSYVVTGQEVSDDGAPGVKGSVQIRGQSTISGTQTMLESKVAGLNIIEDTKVYDFASIDSYDPKTGNYIINGKLIKSLSKVVTRTNFNETAFFYPQLRTNAAGEIDIEFTIPQSLTRYKMMGFAHTKNMLNTAVSAELITQKQFSITANAPRFFREGDTILLTATLNNLSGKKLKGFAALLLSDALTGKVLQLMLPASGVSEGQRFQMADKGNQVLKWPLKIPSSVSAITYKVIAESGKYSDGEEMTVPVLPNGMLVTETMPLNVRGNTSKTFRMDKLLKSGSSPTLRSQSYTLEFTSNPVWYAIQSLPYLMEYPYECSEQTFSRFYANSFASTIISSSPKVAQVFKQWQETNQGEALLSKLEKNQELKSILLEETPWVRNASNESERMKRLAVLFDLNRMRGELNANFDKLQKMQYANGAFPWFSGMQENRYITQHIVLGMAQLKHLKVVDEMTYPEFNTVLNKAIIYLDRQLINDYLLVSQGKGVDRLPLHYLYARSYSKQINDNDEFKTAFTHYLKKTVAEWKFMGLYQQGLAALVLNRNGNHDEAMKIVNSLKERSQITEEMGMFWPGNTDGWWWYQRSVETQALMIEVFDEVATDPKSVEEMKIWLLKNKQTTDWKTTKATTAACYALLMRGHNLLDESAEPEILIANKTLAQLGVAEPQKEAGTGYRKISLQGAQVSPELGKVTVKNNNKTIAWGGVYWQYFEQLDKITPAETGIKIKKQLFLQEQTASGTILHPLGAAGMLKPGDLLKVRIEIYTDRDMEYLHLKDMRSSGFEPVNVISSYKYQDGLGYYESTKDASTNFFIDFMRKGTYVFEYPLRISHAGNFSNGITTLQSMYAPEFSTHSEGIRVTVKP